MQKSSGNIVTRYTGEGRATTDEAICCALASGLELNTGDGVGSITLS
jgi:hypothetical protein